MSTAKRILDFSPNGEYLAYSSPDGCLKIWETSTNILKQEYTPSSHLSATCSSISWCPKKQNTNPAKKSKKSKDDNFSAISDLQLIAMGTLTGDIFLYSYMNADLYSSLTNSHSGVVNDVCWCTHTCTLYSCSSDRNVVAWDAFTGKVRTKWKADNAAVHSVCVIDDNNILTASNDIKWWNVQEKTVVKTFTGHATEVFRLLFVKPENTLENSCFLSTAVGDRVISAWQLNDESGKRAVASFIVTDEPEYLSFIAQPDQPLLLSVVCKDGTLHVFEHILNGRRKKPLSSKFTLQIASKASESHPKAQQIQILCATLISDLSSCLVSYGNFLRPTSERLDLSEVSKDLFLIRDIYASSSSIENDVTRIKHGIKPDTVKLLAPGHMMPIKDIHSVSQKRKKKEADKTADDKELPMEERLRALDLSKIPPNIEEPALKADSMVHLLLQGLQSSDSKLLETVLQSGDEKIIHNTLKKLPLPSIMVLLRELQKRLNKQEQRNHPCLKWIKGLLSIHLPYLMSCKDIDEYLGPISQLIEARVENFSKMCQLQGCLKILLSQATTNETERLESEEALVVYQSESSSSSEETDPEDMDHNIDVSSDEEIKQKVTSEESCSSESEDDMDL